MIVLRYRQVRTVETGFADGLRDVAIDARGDLYAAGDYGVRMYDASGQLKRTWMTTRRALSVEVSPEGTVLAGQPSQIEFFSPAGDLLDTWQDDKLLGRVTAIAFAGHDVLAADWGGRGIRRFNRSGRLLNTIGTDNPVKGFLVCNGVLDIAVDASGLIHAANPGKHCIQQYTPGGELVGRIGRFDGVDPAGFGGCCNPTNIAVGKHIYVTEKAGPRVKAYDFAGNLISIIASDVFDPNCKNMSVEVDASGRVYVADTVKLTIHVFEPEAAHV